MTGDEGAGGRAPARERADDSRSCGPFTCRSRATQTTAETCAVIAAHRGQRPIARRGIARGPVLDGGGETLSAPLAQDGAASASLGIIVGSGSLGSLATGSVES